jgi:hypothetical protein
MMGGAPKDDAPCKARTRWLRRKIRRWAEQKISVRDKRTRLDMKNLGAAKKN